MGILVIISRMNVSSIVEREPRGRQVGRRHRCRMQPGVGPVAAAAERSSSSLTTRQLHLRLAYTTSSQSPTQTAGRL